MFSGIFPDSLISAMVGIFTAKKNWKTHYKTHFLSPEAAVKHLSASIDSVLNFTVTGFLMYIWYFLNPS